MNRIFRLAKSWAPFLLLLGALFFVRTNVGQAAYIPSESMLPTLQVHDILIIDKTVKPDQLQFGDIVVFHPPAEANLDKKLIKRLIGLPGDEIEITDGQLYRNGVKVEESYVKESMKYGFGPITVPEDHYLFLGDNRNESLDSHLWSNPFVDSKKIIGRAVYRIFPFNQITSIR
ncbi:signal peptidase I [Paenibacillus sp. J2TS4]|uniref:signal peptidase I n=1 Tax=Paenibacillus sp. J2TS4 TaxID=2807194 RepID=UPI001B20A85F|nr:signal peptidase I [Paenibacillus sp. J2TS4]GIP33802.1 signal peptidase I [Paenibacillus sp. J2TS4]